MTVWLLCGPGSTEPPVHDGPVCAVSTVALRWGARWWDFCATMDWPFAVQAVEASGRPQDVVLFVHPSQHPPRRAERSGARVERLEGKDHWDVVRPLSGGGHSLVPAMFWAEQQGAHALVLSGFGHPDKIRNRTYRRALELLRIPVVDLQTLGLVPSYPFRKI